VSKLGSRVFFSCSRLTDQSKHRAYGAWHALDHVPENVALDGVALGARWVRTPRCAARTEAEDPELADVQYLTTYWFIDPWERSVQQWDELASRSRHWGRRPELGWTRRVRCGYHVPIKGYVNPRVLVAADVIPYRPNRGVHLSVSRFQGAPVDVVEALRWYDETRIPDLLTCDGAAGAWPGSRRSRPRRPAPRARTPSTPSTSRPAIRTEKNVARTIATPAVEPLLMYIDGKWCTTVSGEVFERRSPFDGSLLAVHQNGDVSDAEAAIGAARRAFDTGPWRRMPARERRDVLCRAAGLLRAENERLMRILSAEVGQPNRGEPLMAAEHLEYYAHLAYDLRDEAVTGQHPDAVGLIASEPIGVVGVITAWNGPLAQTSWKAGPALAVGCSVVTKPSHHTSTAVLELARILEQAGVPAGVFNVVTSDRAAGAVVGEAICASPAVDAVSFTGSTATGRRIVSASTGNLKRVLLELGGKSPNIVFADADLDEAARGAFGGVTLLAGQACQSGTRLLVQESVHDEFVARLVEIFRTEPRLGDPLDPSTTIGPLVTPQQQERVLSYIESGREQGRIAVGGGRPDDDRLAAGSFVQPTIVCDVPVDNRTVREEIFGPVIAVIPFRSPDEAIRIANDSPYGLASGIWTASLDLALRCAKELRAGTVWVNTYRNSGLTTMPFGGYKTSGLGRELGREGLEEFLQKKSIHIKLGPVFGREPA